jgi:sterol desaturase/sphingolipid hydroxylase (fatty acid hydroxylase superfamily)
VEILRALTRWQTLAPVLIVGSAIAIIALERRFPYDPRQRLFRKGWFNDLFYYAFLQSYVLSLVISALIGWLDARAAGRFHLLSGWSLPAQVAFFLVTHDLYIYCFHRLQHRVPLLWRLHEAHHSVENVDWISGARSHALEILINQTIEFAPIVLLGAPPEVAAIKGFLDAAWGMYIHSNIDVRSGRLQYLINGPEMHRWHHSVVFTGYGFNYATKLAIWDWIFGTAHLPADKPPGYGIAGAAGFPERMVGAPAPPVGTSYLPRSLRGAAALAGVELSNYLRQQLFAFRWR